VKRNSTKLAITGMLATRLSYMNDMANLADKPERE